MKNWVQNKFKSEHKTTGEIFKPAHIIRWVQDDTTKENEHKLKHDIQNSDYRCAGVQWPSILEKCLSADDSWKK